MREKQWICEKVDDVTFFMVDNFLKRKFKNSICRADEIRNYGFRLWGRNGSVSIPFGADMECSYNEIVFRFKNTAVTITSVYIAVSFNTMTDNGTCTVLLESQI